MEVSEAPDRQRFRRAANVLTLSMKVRGCSRDKPFGPKNYFLVRFFRLPT